MKEYNFQWELLSNCFRNEFEDNRIRTLNKKVKSLIESYYDIEKENCTQIFKYSISNYLENFISASDNYGDYLSARIDHLYEKHSGEVLLASNFDESISDYYEYHHSNLFAQIILASNQPVDKVLEDIRQRIFKVLKLISLLKTKILQLKKINRKNLFRKQVNLVYKNMDDTHLRFYQFSLVNSMNFRNLKYCVYEIYSKTPYKIP